MFTENTEKFNSLQFIGVVNANETLYSNISIGIWRLGHYYLPHLYQWQDVRDCRYTLENMQDRMHPYWILCVDEEERETLDVISWLYTQYTSPILVIDCQKNNRSRRKWIDYVRAGAAGCITDQQIKHLTSILTLLKQGYGVLEDNKGLVGSHGSALRTLYPTAIPAPLDSLEAQIAELLLDRELIVDLTPMTMDDIALMEKLLMQRLKINKLEDILLDVIEMRWQEKRKSTMAMKEEKKLDEI